MAAPFGPPPSVAITWIFPSGVTRESVRRSISTGMTEPSGIATGPSGNRRPAVICRTLGVMVVMKGSFSKIPRVLDRPPHALGRGRHVDMSHTERREGIEDRVDHGARCADRSAFARALDAERVGWARHVTAGDRERRQIVRARDRIV